MPDLKVVTINVLSDLSRWEQRRPLLVQDLAALQPDLIALQEVSIPGNNAQWLTGKLDMPYLHLTPKTGPEAGREGIAILSRLPFTEQAELDLLTQNRVAQYVRVQVDGRPLVFANGHFYWEPGDSAKRLRQVERLLEWLAAVPGNPLTVVCGDFNARPEAASLRRMRQSFVSAYATIHGREPDYTTPTPLPRSKIFLLRTLLQFIGTISLKDLRAGWKGTLDYIFVDPRLPVRDCRLVLDKPAPDDPRIYPSDHFGLAATLEIENQ